jgi:hypothetical protein
LSPAVRFDGTGLPHLPHALVWTISGIEGPDMPGIDGPGTLGIDGLEGGGEPEPEPVGPDMPGYGLGDPEPLPGGPDEPGYGLGEPDPLPDGIDEPGYG